MNDRKSHRSVRDGAASGARLWILAALSLAALAWHAPRARAEPAAPAQAQRAPVAVPRSRRGMFAPAQWAKIDVCYRDHETTYPGLSVNTTASFFARGDKVVFVHVDLPEAPALARCLAREIETWTVTDPPPGGMRAEDVSVGAVTVELGPVRKAPRFRSSAEVRERQRRMVQQALERGVLRESDLIVQEQRRRDLARPPSH